MADDTFLNDFPETARASVQAPRAEGAAEQLPGESAPMANGSQAEREDSLKKIADANGRIRNVNTRINSFNQNLPPGQAPKPAVSELGDNASSNDLTGANAAVDSLTTELDKQQPAVDAEKDREAKQTMAAVEGAIGADAAIMAAQQNQQNQQSQQASQQAGGGQGASQFSGSPSFTLQSEQLAAASQSVGQSMSMGNNPKLNAELASLGNSLGQNLTGNMQNMQYASLTSPDINNGLNVAAQGQQVSQGSGGVRGAGS